MKILLLAPHPFFQNRGTPIAVKLLIQVLSRQGYQLHILTYHEGEDFEISNGKIIRIPAVPGLKNIKPGPSWKKLFCDFLMFWKCIKVVRLLKFDLVHAVEESAFMALAVKTLYNIPYVYDMDSSFAQQLEEKYKFLRPIKLVLEFMEKMAVKGSVGIIAVCKSLEKTALSYDKSKIVLRLEDISLLKTETEDDDLLPDSLGVSSPIVMYVGNLESYQGIDLLLEGFRFATTKNKEAQLVLIGGSSKDIQRYKNKSKQLGIGDKVHFIGQRPISELAFYLRQADIVVSPRIKGQNTPMKIYSYLDSGKPLLATRISTHTQVLDDQIAFLVQPEPKDFGEGLVELFQDSILRENLAIRAKERVKQEFSYEAFQKKLLTFYRVLEKNISHNKLGYYVKDLK